MSLDVPNDSHESASMAKPPSTAEVDGWEVESSSAVQPSNEELATRLREPVTEDAFETESEGDAGPAPSPVDEDHDDAIADDVPTEEAASTSIRDESGRFAKKKKLTASERKAVLQAEINSFTKRREDARRAFAAEETERETQRRNRTAPVEPPTPAVPVVDPTEPDWDVYEANGKGFQQYQKDHATWIRATVTAEAEARAHTVAEARIGAERERVIEETVLRTYESRLAQATVAHPDFQEMVEANLDGVDQTPFLRSVVIHHPAGAELLYYLAEHPAEAKILSTLPMTRPMMDAVKDTSDPAPVLSYFATHPEDHARIAQMDPPRQLLALGRLLVELSPAGAKNGSPRVTRPVTTAKPPIRPLGTTRSAGVSRDDDDLEFGPEYVRRETDRQIALRARR